MSYMGRSWNENHSIEKHHSQYRPNVIMFIFALCSHKWWNSHLCDHTVSCKGCGENIPAPVDTLPDTWIIAECPLCGVKRRYLPADIFRGNSFMGDSSEAGAWRNRTLNGKRQSSVCSEKDCRCTAVALGKAKGRQVMCGCF